MNSSHGLIGVLRGAIEDKPEFRALDNIMKKAARPRISVDVDGTIANIYPTIIDSYNKGIRQNGGGATYTAQDLADWGWHSLGVTSWELEIRPHYNQVWLERNAEIGFIPDPKLLGRVKEYFEVTLVTVRDRETMPGLTQWLSRHNTDDLPLLTIGNKSDKCDLPFSIFVDDNPNIAERVTAENGRVLLLIDARYNRHVQETPNVKRVADVNQAFGVLVRSAVKAQERRFVMRV